VTSIGVHFDNAVGNVFYVSSKAALDMTTTVLRNEVRPFHIQVMLVEPGTFRTNFRVDGVTAHGKRSDTLYKESHASVDNLKNHLFNQTGDPKKAGRIIFDQVNQETIPEILVLGGGMVDAEVATLQARIEKVKACSEIARQTDFNTENE
jgi:NAD(P)-dependent dehydrogenase (short-subunit alcohol dehydrogenase family)